MILLCIAETGINGQALNFMKNSMKRAICPLHIKVKSIENIKPWRNARMKASRIVSVWVKTKFLVAIYRQFDAFNRIKNAINN